MYEKSYNEFVLRLVIYSVILYVLKKLYDQWRIIRMVMKFDGPKCDSFIFGNLNLCAVPQDVLHRTTRSLAKDFGPSYRLRLLHDVCVTISDPDDIELFMSSRKHSSKSEIYGLLQNWLRNGLLLSDGEKWFQRRKILTPSFHFSILTNFLTVFNEETEKLVDVLSQNIMKPIDVVPLCSELALHIISETAMGTKLNSEDSNQRKYRDAIHRLGKTFLHRLMRPWLYPTFPYILTHTAKQEESSLKILHQFTEKIIKKKLDNFKGIKNGEEGNDSELFRRKQRVAMLDILLQAHRDGNQIDYNGICEEVDTFMFEGHDTTANALSFCMMLIANHPQIQDQLYDEIESECSGNQQPSYTNIQNLELLERVIKESLRLYPSVHFISRKTDEDTLLRSGLVIPKNVRVHFQLYDIHRNAEIFPNPEKFDPDRFLPDNCRYRHPYAYIPFSAGPRNCIGQKFAMLEMKSVLMGILKRFRMVAVDTPDTIVIEMDLVLRSKNGIQIKFEPRI